MSADNYIGYHKVTGKKFWEKKWCVGHGSASIQEEDCQYRASHTPEYRTESQALKAAMDMAAETEILEYGVERERDWSQQFCGRCYVCIHDRDVIAPDIERCTNCGEPFTNTDWRMSNSDGTFHRMCEPQKSSLLLPKTSNLQKGD